MILTGEAYRTELRLLGIRLQDWATFQMRGFIDADTQDSLRHEVDVFCRIRGLHMRYNDAMLRYDSHSYEIGFADPGRPMVFDDSDSTPMAYEEVDELRASFGPDWPIGL